jgi:hypothetical protein
LRSSSSLLNVGIFFRVEAIIFPLARIHIPRRYWTDEIFANCEGYEQPSSCVRLPENVEALLDS